MAKALPAVHYEPRAVLRLLDHWREYRLTQRTAELSVADGGRIQKVQLVTQAGYCLGAEEYADLVRHINSLPDQNRAAVALYWGLGLRSVDRVALRLHHHKDLVRALVWDGAQLLLERMCGVDSQTVKNALRLYRERIHSRRT